MPSGFPLIVLSGPSGAGKSTICRRVIDEVEPRGVRVGGVVSEVRMAGGIVTGLDAVNVATGVRLPLAEFDRPTGGPVTGRWHFHETTIDAGLDWCASLAPETLLVIDEVGPLELVQGLGWAPLVPRLAARPGPALVAVRPALVEALMDALGGRRVLRVDVTPETRETAAAFVVAALESGA